MFQTLRLKTIVLLAMLLTASAAIHAQIGEHRRAYFKIIVSVHIISSKSRKTYAF